jgi:transposase
MTVDSHRSDYDEDKRARAKALYDEGMSVRQVADELGLTVSRTHTLLTEAGTQMRPRGPRKERDGESEPEEADAA